METQSIEQVGLVYCSAAAEQGDADADAQTSLGIMYDNRDGVAEDNAEAVRWYRKAAGQGHVEAKKRLAELGY